jgi:hypothetical protein
VAVDGWWRRRDPSPAGDDVDGDERPAVVEASA